MDQIQKYVDQILDSMGRSQVVRYVMIYMLVVGVITLCGGIALFLAGGLAGFGGALSAGALSQSGVSSQDANEAAAASASLVAVGGIALVLGVLNIILGPAMIVVGLGLRSHAAWSRMGVVVVAGISAITSLVGVLTGGGVLNIVWLIIGAFVVYVFYTDPGIKAEFGK